MINLGGGVWDTDMSMWCDRNLKALIFVLSLHMQGDIDNMKLLRTNMNYYMQSI